MKHPKREVSVKHKCGVCFHPEAEIINQALAQGGAARTLGQKYGMSGALISRHTKCCLKFDYVKMHLEKRAASAFNFGDELYRLYHKSIKFITALEKWMVDADNPEEFDIGPRDVEILVTYLDWRDLNEAGHPKRKKAHLSELLLRYEGDGRRQTMQVKSEALDNRKLYLDSFRTLHDHLEQIGKFEGHFKKEDRNEGNKELDRLRSMILARARERDVTYTEELEFFLTLDVADSVRPEIRTQLISELEQ